MKPIKENPVEITLNKIMDTPDLGENIVNFVLPYYLKAYGLLQSDLFKESSNQDKFFKSVEDKLLLESIVIKDLPGLINLYVMIPLEYRNTHKLKNGLTHRENLLNNIEVLVNKMVQIEKNQYEDHFEELNTNAIVQTKLIKQKCETNFVALSDVTEQNGAELEKEVKLASDFNWEHFKKTLPVEELDRNPVDYKNATEKNHRIKITEGQIDYKVKSHMKNFMAGVYNAYNNAKKLFQSLGKSVYVFYRVHNEGIVVLTVFSLIGLGIYGLVSYTSERYKGFEHLEEIYKYTGASSKTLLAINMKVLEKYVKDNPEVSVDFKNPALVDVKVKTSNRACAGTIEGINKRWGTEKVNYSINGIELNGKVSGERLGEALCTLDDENIVRITFNARK